MSSIIVYDSKYGTTDKYAEWLKTELGISKYRFDELGALNLAAYDTVILCTPVYFGSMTLAQKVIHLLQGQKQAAPQLFWLVTGVHNIDEKYMTSLINRNLPMHVQVNSLFYQIKTQMNTHKLTMKHRLMMQWMKTAEHTNNPLYTNEEGVVETVEVKQSALQKLLFDVRAHERLISLN
ncbi:MAG: flavodoxin domain-containing protein [Lactobacillaceae bacterium]|jgi:menaquinone-dependent protoporphyrinogen IX oxidase|nr:flavodoxin domain-containing protein [Lactobacillaceae bacterium]